MPNPDPGRVRSLFDQAAAVPPAQREHLVRAAAGDDAPLAAEVLALLAGLTQPPEIVVRPTRTAATVGAPDARPERPGAPAPPEPAQGDVFRRGGPMGKDFNLLEAVKLAADEPVRHPERVGSYRVIRPIDEGGFGIVYLAEQASPKREVALKLIRPGLGRGALRRFADEARMLARLQHPGIAQVYEAGVAQVDGLYRAFFAMEYIRGERLDAHIASHMLDTRARLRLLASICHAVHHAHQKGIIHRDLKPANILIDEHGHPKVIDFGVARLTDRDINATTRQSRTGDRIGTLYYMSPEQIAGDPDDLDTRSDVYALGVIGHELLAGELPYEVRGKAEYEIASAIREATPTRLSSVSRAFRGDIETIIGKALSKDKERRYSSASALAGDVERYLRDEPIDARKPSAWYQLRKFSKRHRALAGGIVAAALSLAVAAASIVFAIGTRRISEAREQTAMAIARAERASLFAEQVRSNFTPNILAAIDAEIAKAKDDDVPLRLLRVEVLDALNRFKDAQAEVSALAARTDIGEDRAEVLLWLGDINITSAAGGMTVEQSIGHIREAIALGLKEPDRLYAQALLAGDVTQCRDKLLLAVREDPRHLRAQNLLAFLEFICGDPTGALARARATEALAPQHPNPLIVQAVALTFMDRAGERRPVMAKLSTLLTATDFGSAEEYFELADIVVDINKSGRVQEGILRLIARVAPLVLRAWGAAGKPATEQEVFLRMPGFMSTELNAQELFRTLTPIVLGRVSEDALAPSLDKLRKLGPAVASLIDARKLRAASDAYDFETVVRMAPDILAAPQLLNVNPSVVGIYFFALHQLWVKDQTETSRARAIAAIPILNKHWLPSEVHLARVGTCLADLGFPDEGRAKLEDLAHAFADDPESLREIRYWRARMESIGHNPTQAIAACSLYLDHAPAGDHRRKEVMDWLAGALGNIGMMPKRDGQEQTEADIRARYGLPAASP